MRRGGRREEAKDSVTEIVLSESKEKRKKVKKRTMRVECRGLMGPTGPNL